MYTKVMGSAEVILGQAKQRRLKSTGYQSGVVVTAVVGGGGGGFWEGDANGGFGHPAFVHH